MTYWSAEAFSTLEAPAFLHELIPEASRLFFGSEKTTSSSPLNKGIRAQSLTTTPESQTDVSLITAAQVAFADVRNIHLLFLGRYVSSPDEVLSRAKMLPIDLIRDIVESREFLSEIVTHTVLTGHVAPGRFVDEPRPKLLEWAAQFLPLSNASQLTFPRLRTWPLVIATVFLDETFRPMLEGMKVGPLFRLFVEYLRTHEKEINVAASGALHIETPPSFSPEIDLFIADISGAASRFRPFIKTSGPNLAKVTPINGLGRAHSKNRFVSTGEDPQFMLAGSMPPGYYVVMVDARYFDHGSHVNARFYVDFGHGFSEADSWGISTTSGRLHIRALIHSRRLISRLRFDPSQDACGVYIDGLTIHEVDNAPVYVATSS